VDETTPAGTDPVGAGPVPVVETVKPVEEGTVVSVAVEFAVPEPVADGTEADAAPQICA